MSSAQTGQVELGEITAAGDKSGRQLPDTGANGIKFGYLHDGQALEGSIARQGAQGERVPRPAKGHVGPWHAGGLPLQKGSREKQGRGGS